MQKDHDALFDSNIKTPDKKISSSSSLETIFGNSTFAQLIWKYYDLLVKDAVFSQPFFHLDDHLYNYLDAKICSPIQDCQGRRLLAKKKLEEFLGYKRNEKKSERAKMKGRLLVDSYNSQMRACLQNWASLYFNPSLRNSMYASVAKQVWRTNQDSCLGRLLSSKHVSENYSTDEIFGMSKSIM